MSFFKSKDFKTYKKISQSKMTLKNFSNYLVLEKKLLEQSNGLGVRSGKLLWKQERKEKLEFSIEEFCLLWGKIWNENEEDYCVHKALRIIKDYDTRN